jgi:hypothetical protein
MKCGQCSVFRGTYNDGRLKMILSVPGGDNYICSSMGCSIDNLKKLDYLTALLRADFQDVKFQLCTKTSCRLSGLRYNKLYLKSENIKHYNTSSNELLNPT